jgi:hypothetical protein
MVYKILPVCYFFYNCTKQYKLKQWKVLHLGGVVKESRRKRKYRRGTATKQQQNCLFYSLLYVIIRAEIAQAV